jgi:hypothetical protein
MPDITSRTADMKVLTASAHRWLGVQTSDERRTSDTRTDDPDRRLPQVIRLRPTSDQRPATYT